MSALNLKHEGACGFLEFCDESIPKPVVSVISLSKPDGVIVDPQGSVDLEGELGAKGFLEFVNAPAPSPGGSSPRDKGSQRRRFKSNSAGAGGHKELKPRDGKEKTRKTRLSPNNLAAPSPEKGMRVSSSKSVGSLKRKGSGVPPIDIRASGFGSAGGETGVGGGHGSGIMSGNLSGRLGGINASASVGAMTQASPSLGR